MNYGFVLMALALAGGPARAELGGSVAAVAGDQARLRAGLHRVQLARFERHELTLPNGGAVHEFANSEGRVFAVSWRGPGKPDLRALLGSHFAALQGESIRRGRVPRLRRQPVALASDDVEIVTGGHMGWFWGTAVLPALRPAGVTMRDLAVSAQ